MIYLRLRNCLIVNCWSNYTSTKKGLEEENLIPTLENVQEKTDMQHKLQYDVVNASTNASMHTFIHFLITYSVPISGQTVVTKMNKIFVPTELTFQW